MRSPAPRDPLRQQPNTFHMTAQAQPAMAPQLTSLVSFFDSAFAQEPAEQVQISEVLSWIKAERWGAETARLRSVLADGNEKGYQDAKRRLPAFSISGACLTRDAQVPLERKFMSHSGILQCDFDKKDNPHMSTTKELEDVATLLRLDPHVLFGFISPSGIGFKAGVVIDGTRHADSFLSAERYFLEKYSLQIDRSTKDPLRLCFVSADSNLWINPDAIQLPITESRRRPVMESWSPPLDATSEDIREMLRYCPPRPDYDTWLRIASAVWSVLPMEEGCRLLAEWSPEEKAGEYSDKHRHRLEQVGVGTLAFYAQQHGFDAAAAARRKRWAGRIRFADTPGAEDHSVGETDPHSDIKSIELSREFLWRCVEEQQVGDARLYAAISGGKKLYDHLAQTWRTYSRGVWEKDDLKQTIVECTEDISKAYDKLISSIRQEIAQNPPPEGKKDTRQRTIATIIDRQAQLHKKAYIAGVLTFAESMLATKATFFDKKSHLICLENGVIDFDQGVFREHRASDMLTVRAHIPFNPEAQCPRWLAFIEFAMGSDREMVAYLARAVGYSLTGYVDKDALFFCYGKGANGKSTFTSALKMLGGELMTTISIEALLTKQSDNNFDYKKAMLEGKRIVVTDEIPESRTLNDSGIKSLVGGDEITARRPYEKPYTFEPTHKLWLVGNHKPKIKGVDYGIWRRIHLIPWLNTIPEDKRRPRHEILAELRAELSGILNWAIRGYIDMQENGGLRPPAAVTNATNEYKKDSDQMAQFIDERMERDPTAETPCKEICKALGAWCEDNGEVSRYPDSRKATAYFSDLGFEVRRKGAAKHPHIIGIKITPYD